MDFDWCRDVDYGNLPQWIAVIVGAIVAAFTIWGIWTARASYKDDVRTRKFAQARLIFAEVGVSQRVGGPDVAFLQLEVRDRDLEIIVFADPNDGHLLAETSWLDKRLVVTTRAREPVHVFLLRVHNNSDELISMVSVSLTTANGQERLSGKVRGDRVVRPGSAVEKLIVTDPADWTAEIANVTFRDSSGRWWSRSGAEPVAELDGAPRDD